MTLPDHLAAALPDEMTRLLGEVLLSKCAETNTWLARHIRDKAADSDSLQALNTVQEIREMVKYDKDGEYRPLKTAPNMKCGWIISDPDITSFYTKVDALYPAAYATSARYFEGRLAAVPLRQTLDRQTGMYQFAKGITDQHANQIMRDTCAKGCLRTIAWPIDDSCPVSQLPNQGRNISLVCTEACTFAVTEARRLAREAYDKANPPEG